MTDQETLVALRAKTGSGTYKMLALDKNEILHQVTQLADLNAQIYKISQQKATQFHNPESENYFDLTIAFFNALCINSFTALRSKLDEEFHKQ